MTGRDGWCRMDGWTSWLAGFTGDDGMDVGWGVLLARYFYTTYYRSGQEAHLTTVHFVYLPCCVADVTARRDKRACEIFEA